MRTYFEIDSRNLLHNLNAFHQLTKRRIMFVVKGNAYGHGLREVVKIAKALSCIRYFVVDSLEEALIVKKENVQQAILIIGWLDADEQEVSIRNGFETVVSSKEHMRQIRAISHKLKLSAQLHIKVETGTNRLGFDPDDAFELLKTEDSPDIKFIGIYSHFANIEDTTDPQYARCQLNRFLSLLKKVKNRKLLRHFSCSASALLFPETYLDMVRIGISAFGYWPSKQTYLSYIEKHRKLINLKRVLNWYSHIAQIKTLAKNSPIGYGLTYKTISPSRIAVIPVGYYDGFDRRLSNLGYVIINHESSPIRGRICMNMFMVEVTHIKKINMGDQVILLGREGDENIDANIHADLIGSINYEILARLNPGLPRLII